LRLPTKLRRKLFKINDFFRKNSIALNPRGVDGEITSPCERREKPYEE
jgi:hypothetical protein